LLKCICQLSHNQSQDGLDDKEVFVQRYEFKNTFHPTSFSKLCPYYATSNGDDDSDDNQSQRTSAPASTKASKRPKLTKEVLDAHQKSAPSSRLSTVQFIQFKEGMEEEIDKFTKAHEGPESLVSRVRIAREAIPSGSEHRLDTDSHELQVYFKGIVQEMKKTRSGINTLKNDPASLAAATEEHKTLMAKSKTGEATLQEHLVALEYILGQQGRVDRDVGQKVRYAKSKVTAIIHYCNLLRSYLKLRILTYSELVEFGLPPLLWEGSVFLFPPPFQEQTLRKT
jgi:hypothetical protein